MQSRMAGIWYRMQYRAHPMQVQCRMQPQQGCRWCIMPTTMCPLQGNSSSLLGNFPPLQGNSSSLLDHLRPWPHIQQYLTPGSGSTLRRAPLSCLLAQAPLNHILGTVASTVHEDYISPYLSQAEDREFRDSEDSESDWDTERDSTPATKKSFKLSDQSAALLLRVLYD